MLGPQPPDRLRRCQQTAATAEGQKRFTGHPISLDFQGADLRAVLRGFSEISGLNMVIDPDVQGTVDIILNDVPWDQALDVILRGNQLDYTVDGTIVRIARMDNLRKEQDSRTALAKSASDAGTLAVRTFGLSYAKAAAAAPLVKKAALSSRGDVQIDERTNTLIITDLPGKLEVAATLLATIDRAEPQVEVEARIVQTSREFARAIGVQWGLNGRVMPDVGNTTPLAFPNQGTLGGRLGSQGTDRSPRRRYREADEHRRQPSGARRVSLDVRHRAGARLREWRVQPRCRADRARALGQRPHPLDTAPDDAEQRRGGSRTGHPDPHSSGRQPNHDGHVQGRGAGPEGHAADHRGQHRDHEDHHRERLGGLQQSVNGIPPINTQRANTQVQINDGATTIIGGIFISEENSSTDKTPMLSRVPLLGWLFKRDAADDSSRELLIFITPRILKG